MLKVTLIISAWVGRGSASYCARQISGLTQTMFRRNLLKVDEAQVEKKTTWLDQYLVSQTDEKSDQGPSSEILAEKLAAF